MIKEPLIKSPFRVPSRFFRQMYQVRCTRVFRNSQVFILLLLSFFLISKIVFFNFTNKDLYANIQSLEQIRITFYNSQATKTAACGSSPERLFCCFYTCYFSAKDTTFFPLSRTVFMEADAPEPEYAFLFEEHKCIGWAETHRQS